MLCNFIEVEGGIKCEICELYIKGNFKVGQIKKTCSKQLYPTMLEMTKNAVKAGIDFVKDGFKTVDEEEQKRRISICTGNAEAGIPACPAYDKEQNRCRECGCFLNWATTVNSKHCPLDKW